MLVFLDVDGTLCNSKGRVLKSSMEAINKARVNGHKVYLCTGRSMTEIMGDLLLFEYDGIIASAGGYILNNHEVMYDRCFTKQELNEVLKYLDEHRVGYYLESNNGLFVSDSYYQYLEELKEKFEDPQAKAETDEFMRMMTRGNHEGREDIRKISFNSKYWPLSKMQEVFTPLGYTVIQSSFYPDDTSSGELSLSDVHKGAAILKVIEYLNYDQQETMGIGDSTNDHEMLETVAHPVAMGNASEALKQIAEFVTLTNDEDGIYEAFKHYQLI